MQKVPKPYLQEYKFTLKGMLKFEIISFLGRYFFSHMPSRAPKFHTLTSKEKNYLNLGCGNQLRQIMGGGHTIINADFFSHLKPYKTYSTPMPEWQLDLRYPLQCPHNIFDGVFSEHTLEHLYIDDAIALLREIFRILKPNGTIRLSVPDLEFHIQQYLNAKKQDSTQQSLASEYIRKLTQDYLHLSVWDYDGLSYALEMVGFVDIQRSSFNNGRDKSLLFDATQRAFASLYVEASKPL